MKKAIVWSAENEGVEGVKMERGAGRAKPCTPLLNAELYPKHNGRQLKFFNGAGWGEMGVMTLVLETNYCGHSVEDELEKL